MARVELKTIKDRVTYLLETKPHLRDDDGKLIASMWWQDLRKRGINAHDISAFHLMEMFIANQITHPESIRRERANLQKNNAELRGENYELRKGNQGDIRKDLGYEE